MCRKNSTKFYNPEIILQKAKRQKRDENKDFNIEICSEYFNLYIYYHI